MTPGAYLQISIDPLRKYYSDIYGLRQMCRKAVRPYRTYIRPCGLNSRVLHTRIT